MADLELARKEAVRLLCQAQADTRLSVDTFETRLDQVRRAPNEATLAAILADLEPLPVPYLMASPDLGPEDHTGLASPVSPADHLRIATVFGSTKRAGSWTVPLLLELKVLVGETTIDLRDAVFGADVVDIEVEVLLGSFTLIVPVGTQVESAVEETLSSSSHSTRNARNPQPNGLLIRIRGSSLLGSVDIKEKPPTGNRPPGFLKRLLGKG